MKKTFIIIIFFIFYSCYREAKHARPNFQEFIYARNEVKKSICLKFHGNDTLYIQKELPNGDLMYYTAILNDVDRDSLIFIINNLIIEKNSRYSSQIKDGITQEFILHKEKKTKSVYLHGEIGPKKVNDLGNWLKKLAERQNLIQNKKAYWRWQLQNLALPPPPALRRVDNL